MTKHWKHSSAESPICRIDLGRSRLVVVCIATLGVLAAVSLALSELRWPGVVAGSAIAFAYAAYEMRLETRRRSRSILFRGDGRAEIDGQPVEEVDLGWQGPIGLLGWTEDSRRRRLILWPDVIDAAQRRELRLWTLAHRPGVATPAVAP